MKQRSARWNGRFTKRKGTPQMSTISNSTAPVALVLEKDGNLSGKRRLAGDFDEAAEVAEEIDGRVFALEPVEPNPELMPPVRVVPVSDDVHPWSETPPAPISSQAGLASIRRQTFTDFGPEAA